MPRTSPNRVESRQIAAKVIGRIIGKGEVVHHIDGNPFNNEPHNLLVCTRRQHYQIHRIPQQRRAKLVDILKRLTAGKKLRMGDIEFLLALV
jgi:HNH endonuclease